MGHRRRRDVWVVGKPWDPLNVTKLARVSSGINIAVGEPGQGMLVNELALLLLRFDDRLSSNVP